MERKQDPDLEGVSRSDVLEFLGYLARSPLEVTGDTLLLSRLDTVELLAEVAVDDVLHGIVVRAEAEVVATAQRRMLGAHVHLQMLEEVVVLVAGEGHEDADGAADGRVDERLATSGDESCLLQRHHCLANVETGYCVCLLRSTV